MRLEENFEVFPSNRIQSVTASGLLFLNNESKFEFVDFEECYARWLTWELQNLDRCSPPMNESQFRELTKEWKEVGSRDALNEVPFMVFYTEPQVCFEFEIYEEISDLRRKMWELGHWSTFDLA